MGSHGLTGARKLFFGSTTERVLRETSVPVLVTPATDLGPAHVEDVKRIVKRILAPVDLTAATTQQVKVARGLADALDARLILVHVVEPTRPARVRLQLPSTDLERRARAETTLNELASAVPPRLKAEGLVVSGDPAEEIAKVVRHRGVGLIVMGLHASLLAGPRMGSVTYRVLCLARRLVLALPPALEPGASSIPRRTAAEVAAADC
jgi:nucleotide-binding universal stress UspA family protein